MMRDEKNAIKAIIWDMGGVFLRTETIAPRITIAERLGISYDLLNHLVFSSESSNLAELGKITRDEHWMIVAKSLNLIESAGETLEEEFFSADQFDQEMLGYVQGLRAVYKTGLISNAWHGTREYLHGRYNFLDAFDQAVFSYEVGIRKPDPGIYLICLEKLGIKPGEAVFIDDFENNVQGAKDVGMQAILFRVPSEIYKDLNALI